jgi:predicted ArsR family transcriptional regulator
VGRAPKVYRPTDLRIDVSIPRRAHGLLADLLLDGIRTQRPAESGREAAVRAAADHGRALGDAERDRERPGRLGAERALTYAVRMLERHGFEPARVTPTLVRLRNCPFQPLAGKDPELVCAINHAFVSGFLDGLGTTALDATLVPRPGACCVELTPAPVSHATA